MPTKQIKKTHNYFISSAGYVFKIENGKEVRLIPRESPESKYLYVDINKKECNLLFLMIEYFLGDVSATESFSFSINKNKEIPANSIKIKKLANGSESVLYDSEKIKLYKCDIKAGSANRRAEGKVTPVEVLNTLIIHCYKCIYCGTEIQNGNWHLDHFSSLHKGGRNVFENLVPSCEQCNIMKGDLDGNQFYKRCFIIYKNYMFKVNDGQDVPGHWNSRRR